MFHKYMKFIQIIKQNTQKNAKAMKPWRPKSINYVVKVLLFVHQHTLYVKARTVLHLDINLAYILAHNSQSEENTARAEPY